MNIMILSPGRRVDIVEYFKLAVHKVGGKVFTADMSKYAPALYSGDEHFVINKDFNNLDKYIQDVINICKDKEVNAIITLIDPELVLLAENYDKFKKNGIIPIVSDYDEIINTFDKYAFATSLKNKINVIPTFNGYEDAINAIENGELKFPIFAKVRNGSGSEGIGRINSIYELQGYKDKKNFIFQPCILKKEYGVDVYFDMISGKIVSIFIKHKINMRSGETDKSISIYREDIVREIMKLQEMKFKGPIDVDVFEDESGMLYINEINPRFGGGYPHAYNSGVNFIDKIVNNLNGKENETSIGQYKKDLVMMKYNGTFFIEKENLG
ncbi:MAG: ATP-grasp domain-containing protein [Clostridiales bacterium]|nr:ATP-grasp domain-containing protein [Clostridiales bacterium]